MSDKTLIEKISQGRQFRSMTMEVEKRTEGDEKSYIVKGYATTFNEPYVLYNGGDWEYREQIAPDAFKECDMSDVILQFDHCGAVYARISNNTLKLSVDEHGLFVEADLSKTEKARSLYEDIASGMVTKMSFGFIVAEDNELRTNEENKEVWLRTITKVGKLYDVSAVSLPANDGTEISARSLVEGVMARRSQENDEEQKRQAEEEQKRQEQEAQEKAKRERERLALELELSLSLSK